MIYRYGVYGLTVVSDFQLELPRESPGENSNLSVRLEFANFDDLSTAAPGYAPVDGNWFSHTVLDDGAISMRWGDLFHFVVSADGRRVRCRRLSSSEIESFEAYLTTFAISAAIVQQGEEPLHATVVATDGGGIGLVGPSGAGKSTLAAFLIGRGGDLVTDDMLRLEFKDSAVIAFPGPPRLKLYKEPARRFLKQPLECGRFNPLTEKYIFQLTRSITCLTGPQPISALYFLDTPSEQAHPNRISIARLSGVELFKTITASTFNDRLVGAARLERQFHFAGRIARTIPVYKLTYPHDYNVLDQVADLIDQTAIQ
jgi:hypothetical protein